MISVNSLETEKLQKLIADKKKYMSKLTNKTASQFLQAEILFMERDVLPAVEVGTQLLHYECAKYFIHVLDLSIRFDCNGALVYIPLKTEYKERPKVGIFNPKDLMPDSPGAISIQIINMDENGTAVEPVNLHLNALI